MINTFGTLISRVDLDTSFIDNSVQTMMHHDTAINDNIEKNQ